MARGGVTKRDLCVYMAEAGEKGVSEATIQLVIRCLQDKMFSGNVDTICLARDDERSFEFTPLSLTLLRKIENTFRNPRRDDSKSDLVGSITTVMELLADQVEEDAYEDQKILYFTNLMNEVDSEKLSSLVTALGSTNIFLSIVYPDKDKLSFSQVEQVELLEHIFQHMKTVYIASLPQIRKVLANTLNKKPKRSMAWNVDLEIGPDMRIGVQGYIKCRQNSRAQLKTALEKDGLAFGSIQSSQSGSGTSTGNDLESRGLVLANDAVEKEVIWTEENGTVVDKEHVIPAYFYGDRMVTFDDAEQEFQYKSGEKCLQVLLFLPRENIWPCYLLGDGNDIIVANSKDPGADLKLSALVHAMHNTKRVAMVRKVRTNNSKMVIGVLAPDISKNCLVYTQLSFADDISMPYLTPLIKEEEQDSVGEGLSAKEALMDELIVGMSLDDYDLEAGPVDPAVQEMRDSITCKLLGKGVDDWKGILGADNIDLFFQGLKWQEEVTERIEGSFPLKAIRVKTIDRPSGADIFLKREAIEAPPGQSDQKKAKLEVKNEDSDDDEPVMPVGDVDDDDLTAFLYAFDFDHTIIQENSDTEITCVLPHPLPDELKKFYDGTNWTEFMDKVMTYIASQGIDLSQIIKSLQEMTFAPGMKELLDRICSNRDQNDPGSKGQEVIHRLLILSDANTFFIRTILDHGNPAVTPNEVITNSGIEEDGVLRVYPYENQSSCVFCPKNLCKGSALEKYIENEGPFDVVYYTGDGRNDLCPGLRLRECDTLFVRKGFALQKILDAGTVKGNEFQVKAKIIFYDDGAQIMSNMKFK